MGRSAVRYMLVVKTTLNVLTYRNACMSAYHEDCPTALLIHREALLCFLVLVLVLVLLFALI